MKTKTILLTLLSIVAISTSSAITFNFQHSGFSDGGILYGTFTGEDANNDGFIIDSAVFPTGEISFFGFVWTGNANSPAFTLSSSDIPTPEWSLVFEWPNGDKLGDNPAEFSFNLGSGVGYLASGIGGAIYTGDIVPSAFSQELLVITVANVPDHSSALALLSFSIVGIAALRRRFR
ncbi:VPDSG-CTERM sorting domain-containing protein [Pelagicoccus sp. SDUM812005]|uniref:VPDSG-CTERM sorting domain-containing protein n=1 Tax=Pelagicoccus sp. SDUM812005 TaxID=3041257 RepID=UPI0028101F1F|nr:VPDSG-CTERM sorting domain-containing protein [Pelagicoccus sp. SDUM812005]MDQ8180644.1 VPDSG-CTERM sorting domain-containing protein [Pelagicoccus sp. SDUM812005]